MPIPLNIKHDDLMQALKPLCDLLGVAAEEIYLDPPLSIAGPAIGYEKTAALGRITFSVPARSEEWDGAGRPPGVRDRSHPQGENSHDEWRHFVSVDVI